MRIIEPPITDRTAKEIAGQLGRIADANERMAEQEAAGEKGDAEVENESGAKNAHTKTLKKVKEPLMLDKTGREIAKQVRRIADHVPVSREDGASIFAVPGKTNADKLWNAVNSGGQYTGGNRTLRLNYDKATPPSEGKASCRWYLLYRDNYPEMNDNAETTIRNVVFEPEGNAPVLMQFMFGVNGSLTFENCVFRNVLFYFGRAGKYKFTFRNCIIEDNQYQFIQCSNWHNGAEYHIERCTFRHMRPDLEEYRKDIHSKYLLGWAYGYIRCCAYDTKWFISDSVFEDDMGALTIMFRKSDAVQGSDPKRLELYMTRCTIRKTNGAGITFEGQPATGWIKDCNLYDIGANRCNGEGYDLPEDYAVVSGSGTEADPYIYKCGVGANGIFSYNGRCRHELVITGNRIFNVVENGIEGDYREVSYNHIENTGCRMDEGMWNPSTEGIYGTFAVCKGNVILNPTKHKPGIVITGSYQDKQRMVCEDNVITFDKAGKTNDAAGIRFNVEQEGYNCQLYIRNNHIMGFRKKYDLYNKLGASLANVHIEDVGEQDNVLSGADYYQKNLTAVSFGSDKEEPIVRDAQFAKLDDNGQPTEWHVLYGDAAVYKTPSERFIRIQGTSMKSCAGLAQDYHLGGDIYIARIRCKARSSTGMIGFAPLSLKDDGSITENYEDFVFNPKMCSVPLPGTGTENKWREVTHSMVVTNNCRIHILNPGFDDSEGLTYRSTLDVKDIDIRITRVQTCSDAANEPEKAGTLFDFSNVASSYLPSNAMTVDYYIPDKDGSYTGSWEDAAWTMGKYTGKDKGRGRVCIRGDVKQYTPLVAWYESDFDLELNGHTLECASADEFAFLNLCNGAKVRIVGPGTIKAKNYAVSISSGCELTVTDGVSIETTGSSYAVIANKGNAEKRTVLNIHGGAFGPVLALTYTQVNFKMEEGSTASISSMNANGAITMDKDTKVVKNGTDITNLKGLTGLVSCKNVGVSHQAGHTKTDLAITGDESSVLCAWTDENGQPQELECSLTDAFYKARTTKDTRQGVMTIRLEGDVYTYTGFYFQNCGLVELNLNGYSIKNDCQSYTLYFTGDSRVTICDTPDRSGVTGVVESTNYSAMILNGAGTQLECNGGRIRQATDIALSVINGAAMTLSGSAELEGRIGIQAGTDTSVVLNGGRIRATNIGVQANPQENSTTTVTVHGGTIMSDNVTIYAQKAVFDGVAGKKAVLTGRLDLTENAEITNGTLVMADNTVVDTIRRWNGTVTIMRKE